MRRIKKILIGFFIFLVLFSIIGFFILPPVVKSILIDKLSQTLHRQVAIQKISINPFNLTASLKGVVIREPSRAQTFVSFDEFYVNAQGFSSLFKRAVILKEVRLVRPYVHISRNEDGTYNFSDLIPKGGPKETKETKPLQFSLNNIHIINGSIDFEDRPMKMRHTAREINLTVPFISDVGQDIDHYVEPRFSARINGTPYEIVGKTKPFTASKVTSFDLDIKNIDIPYYLNYVPVKLNCKLASARLDVKLGINFIMPQGKSPSITITGNLGLKDILLDDLKQNKILKIPALNIALASVEPMVPDIHLSRIAVQSPELVIKKSRAGDLNLMSLVATEQPKKPEKKEVRKVPPPAKKTTMRVLVDEFAIESGNLAYTDLQPEDGVNISLSPLNLVIKKLSTEKGSSANVDLSLTLNKKGLITVKGPLGMEPLRANLDLDIKDLGIRTFQPYFTDKVKIDVTRGAIATAGRFNLDQDDKGKSRFTYTGRISVANLATIDKASSDDFVNWKQLYFDQIAAGFNPFFINIKGVSLTDFYAKVSVNSDGTMNLQSIFGGNGKEAEKASASKPATMPATTAATDQKETAKSIKIGKVTLQGGTIDFSDQFIKPNYAVKMLNIGGSVSGLSSEEITRAAIDLKGNLGQGSPIEIAGNINPLVKDLYADIKIRFKDIELSQATPYAIKYIGYPILKGKLTFDVAYLIDKRKLDAKNNFFIDQLTFGERVESPTAIKAPVPFAVSLLADRNGQINLDVPISGSLDDPKFKVWPIIWKIIGNIITKAVTAPFSLLASLIGGGGEEMSYIEFDYGSNTILEAGQQKLSSLVKALTQRPNIKMEMTGFVDSEKDKEGLKSVAFNRQVKAQKLKKLVKKAEATESQLTTVDQIEIPPQEYEKYLTLAYEAAKFPKPRNAIGMLKELPVPEMEKLMLSHIDVTDNDLRQLASRRAESVKEQLLKTGGIDPGRIFVVTPLSPSPEKKEKVKASRVEFKLK